MSDNTLLNTFGHIIKDMDWKLFNENTNKLREFAKAFDDLNTSLSKKKKEIDKFVSLVMSPAKLKRLEMYERRYARGAKRIR